MDPTIGTQTAITQAASSTAENESTWLDSVLSSRLPLPSGHPFENLRTSSDDLITNLKIPGRRMEPWRFTDLRAIYSSCYVPSSYVNGETFSISDVRRYVSDIAGIVLVFVDGIFSEELSLVIDDSATEWKAKGGYFGSIRNYKGDIPRVQAMLTKAELGSEKGGMFPTLGNAIASDAAVLHIPADFSVSRPVAVLNLYSGGRLESLATACAPRLIVIAEENSKLMLLESHAATNGSHSLSLCGHAILVESNASVSHYLVNDCGDGSHFVSNLHATVKQGAEYKLRPLSFRSDLCRFTIGVDLEETEAHGTIHGVLVASGSQIHDIHSRICHDAMNTTSNQLQKNIAADRSRAIFNGKVVVTKNGDKTDSKQLCNSLLLSNKAGVDAMPFLEIATDDVKCTHGATVSDLQEDELFYCQSRGLSMSQAQFLLVTGFAKSILDDCPFSTVLEQLNEKVQIIASVRLERDTNAREMSSM